MVESGTTLIKVEESIKTPIKNKTKSEKIFNEKDIQPI